jgi:hypothetical protein
LRSRDFVADDDGYASPMKRTALVKIAALATSLGLAGLYVANRAASAREGPAATAPRAPVDSPAVNGVGDVVPASSKPAFAPKDATVFYGSKSAPMFRPEDLAPPSTPKDPPKDTPPDVSK